MSLKSNLGAVRSLFFRTYFALEIVAVVVTGAGCSNGLDGLDSSTQFQRTPVIGGTATTNRPEVAEWLSDLGGCGATLISARYAISAAHCNYGLPATIRNSRFNGTTDIDRVWIFGAGPEVESNPGNFNQDVMLMHLAATPAGMSAAQISTRWATIGEEVTLFGFGPSNAGCIGGPGKNYLTFNLDTVNHVCVGDSGGPMFLGSLTANGALVAVTSSANAPKQSYGDAVMFREDIATAMRLWDGDLEVGLDRPGGDLPGMPVASPNALDCRTKCQGNSGCVAFTWVTSGLCYQKRVLMPWFPNSNCTSGAVQQATERLEANIDRNGGDFYSFATTATGCRNACARDGRCRAFTHFNGICYLKSYVPTATALTGATSGVRAPPQYQQERAGAPIGEGDFLSQLPYDCAAWCASTSGCLSYNWRRALIGLKAHCTLLGTNPTPTPSRMEFATQDAARSFY